MVDGVAGQATRVDASTSVLDTTKVILVTVAVVLVVLAIVVLLWPGSAPSSARVDRRRGARSHAGKCTSESSTVVAPAARSSSAGCGPVVTATIGAFAVRGRDVVRRVAHFLPTSRGSRASVTANLEMLGRGRDGCHTPGVRSGA